MTTKKAKFTESFDDPLSPGGVAAFNSRDSKAGPTSASASTSGEGSGSGSGSGSRTPLIVLDDGEGNRDGGVLLAGGDEEELPEYSAIAGEGTEVASSDSTNPNPSGLPTYNPDADPPPFSSYVAETGTHYSHSSVITHDPHLNTDGEALYRFLLEQSKYPPHLTARIYGSHRHRVRGTDGKMKDETKTDFDFKVDFTGCLFELVMGSGDGGELRLVEDEVKVHRGGLFKTRMKRDEGKIRLPDGIGPDGGGSEARPTTAVGDANDEEDVRLLTNPAINNNSIEIDIEASMKETIRDWADSYCASTAHLKQFTVTKVVSNIDYPLLKRLLTDIIRSTNYRGNISITFPSNYHKIIVYPDNNISRWRMNKWIRWGFYLTFLWIITWPILFFTTKKWNVVESHWKFGFIVDRRDTDIPERIGLRARPHSTRPQNQFEPIPQASEEEFCRVWTKAIKYAAKGRRTGGDCLAMIDRQAAEEDEMRESERALGRGVRVDSGNRVVDGVLGVMAGAVGILGDVRREMYGTGWGGDE